MRLSKRRQNGTGTSPIISGAVCSSFDKVTSAFLQAQDALGHSKATHSDYKTVVGIFIRYLTSAHGYTFIERKGIILLIRMCSRNRPRKYFSGRKLWQSII